MRRKNILDTLMAEKIKFGGLVVTRGKAVTLMQRGGIDWKTIDYFSFMPPALPTDSIDENDIADKLFYQNENRNA